MRQDLKRAVSLVRKGASYGEAAKKCGVTRNAVAGACSRAGLITGRAFAGGDGSRTASAIKLYNDGLKYADIASKMRLSSPRAVCAFLRKAGVTLNRNKRYRNRRSP